MNEKQYQDIWQDYHNTTMKCLSKIKSNDEVSSVIAAMIDIIAGLIYFYIEKCVGKERKLSLDSIEKRIKKFSKIFIKITMNKVKNGRIQEL